MTLKKLAMLATIVICTLAIPALAFGGGEPPPPPTSPCVDLVGSLPLPSNANKVSLCHFTGGTNVVLNEPSISAFTPHTSHHGDCWKFFDGTTGCA